MNEEYIRGLVEHLEEIGAESSVIDEVVAALPKNRAPDVTKWPTEDVGYTLGEMILPELPDDADWRKKAAIAANRISGNLDNGY